MLSTAYVELEKCPHVRGVTIFSYRKAVGMLVRANQKSITPLFMSSRRTLSIREDKDLSISGFG